MTIPTAARPEEVLRQVEHELAHVLMELDDDYLAALSVGERIVVIRQAKDRLRGLLTSIREAKT